MSYRQIFYQIVFGTKYREATIEEANCEELYKYIGGIIRNKSASFIALMELKIIYTFFLTSILQYHLPVMLKTLK